MFTFSHFMQLAVLMFCCFSFPFICKFCWSVDISCTQYLSFPDWWTHLKTAQNCTTNSWYIPITNTHNEELHDLHKRSLHMFNVHSVSLFSVWLIQWMRGTVGYHHEAEFLWWLQPNYLWWMKALLGLNKLSMETEDRRQLAASTQDQRVRWAMIYKYHASPRGLI